MLYTTSPHIERDDLRRRGCTGFVGFTTANIENTTGPSCNNNQVRCIRFFFSFIFLFPVQNTADEQT